MTSPRLLLLACLGCAAPDPAFEARVVGLEADVDRLMEQLSIERGVLPQVSGAVLSVGDPWPGLVVLDVGAEQGVHVEFTFEAYSGNRYKGRMRVISVTSDRCLCVIEKLYDGRTIAPGDNAATHI